MRIVKILVILLVIYAGIVTIFESLLGYYQPAPDGTLVITTTDSDGERKDRVLARLVSDETLYVAVNHWPRAWYWHTLDDPKVSVTFGDAQTEHTAVQVYGEEFDRVDADHPLPLVFRILTGFPPRHILRLDPMT